MSAYAHNETLLVKRGDRVKRGQTIARVGQTGSVTEPQLHFELRRGTEAVNPIPLLDRRSS
jgi:murein DD-endopeptidase MepM/ murein hydrolase activator NlpD